METWLDIKGYEGLYQVSNFGRVRSLDRIITYSNGRERYYKGKEKAFAEDKDGYLIVCLNKNGSQKNFKVHRLVGEAFLENPNNKPQINHIDENKKNNKVSNLEWATSTENNTHGDRIKKTVEKTSISVIAFKDGEKVGEYSSMVECGKALGIASSGIGLVLSGKRKTSGGYTFQKNN